jgi:hypothetical protein
MYKNAYFERLKINNNNNNSINLLKCLTSANMPTAGKRWKRDTPEI